MNVLSRLAREYALQPEDYYDLIAIGRCAIWRAKQEGRNPWNLARSDMAHYRRDKARTIRIPAHMQEGDDRRLFPPLFRLQDLGNFQQIAPHNTEREAIDHIRCRQILARFTGKTRALVAAYMAGMRPVDARKFAGIEKSHSGYEANIRRSLIACGYRPRRK